MNKNWKWLRSIIGGALLICAFQNCGGDLTPLTQAVEGQSLFNSEEDLDNAELPGLLNNVSLVYWKKNTVVSISQTPIFADANAVILAVDAGMTGTVYSLNAGANTEESRVSISAGKVRISHSTDASNYSYLEANVPSGAAKFLIAASFGTDASDLSLMINGTPQAGTVQKAGTPLAFSYLLKTQTLGATGGNVDEAVIYASALSTADLNVMSRYVAASSVVANVVFDPSVIPGTGSGGGAVVTAPTAQFLAAKGIIDSNCTGCHNSSNNGDFRNLTQDQFIQKGLVTPSNPAASKIYYRLNGSLSGPGPATMPQGGSLSAGQVQAIADWINSIH